jgi:mannose-1-phosphate guanylyltransferase
MIPALVLTAGLATRLRPLSFVRAKAAMPVAGQPLVQRILRWLASAGVADAVLNLHHLPETITGVVGNGAADGLRVRYSWEMPVLGSAGGPRHALSLLGSSAFLIVNGDTLTNVDVAALVTDHTRSGALVTMAVIPNTDPDKYSGLAVDATGAFTGVVSRGSRQSSYHFVGVQVAEAEAFATLPDNRRDAAGQCAYVCFPGGVFRYRNAGRLPEHIARVRRSRIPRIPDPGSRIPAAGLRGMGRCGGR